jgi:hypothetical protein
LSIYQFHLQKYGFHQNRFNLNAIEVQILIFLSIFE